MFKRGKSASGDTSSEAKIKPGAASAFSSQSNSDKDEASSSSGKTVQTEGPTKTKGPGDLSTRAATSRVTKSTSSFDTSSFDTRKTHVRTLSSGHSSSSTAAPANLHVGRGLKLEGKIQSCDSLVIEGNVQATIDSESLTITDTGEVTGEATVGNAEINGKFDGTLTVRGCLTINATGRITGTVHYGELKVEQGGKIDGQIDSQEIKAGKAAAPAELASSVPLRDAASA